MASEEGADQFQRYEEDRRDQDDRGEVRLEQAERAVEHVAEGHRVQRQRSRPGVVGLGQGHRRLVTGRTPATGPAPRGLRRRAPSLRRPRSGLIRARAAPALSRLPPSNPRLTPARRRRLPSLPRRRLARRRLALTGRRGLPAAGRRRLGPAGRRGLSAGPRGPLIRLRRLTRALPRRRLTRWRARAW